MSPTSGPTLAKSVAMRFMVAIITAPLGGVSRLKQRSEVWINQCVGSHNHRIFVLFLLSLTALAWSYAAMMRLGMKNRTDKEASGSGNSALDKIPMA